MQPEMQSEDEEIGNHQLYRTLVIIGIIVCAAVFIIDIA